MLDGRLPHLRFVDFADAMDLSDLLRSHCVDKAGQTVEQVNADADSESGVRYNFLSLRCWAKESK